MSNIYTLKFSPETWDKIADLAVEYNGEGDGRLIKILSSMLDESQMNIKKECEEQIRKIVEHK